MVYIIGVTVLHKNVLPYIVRKFYLNFNLKTFWPRAKRYAITLYIKR